MKFLIVIGITLCSLYSSGQTSQEYFNKASYLFIQNDLDSSKTILNQGLKQFPKDSSLVKLYSVVFKANYSRTKIVVSKEVKNTSTIKTSEEKSPEQITKALLNKYPIFVDGSKLNIEKGKQLLCFFSLTCGHCQDSFKELCELSKSENLPQMKLYLYGKEFEQRYFFNLASDCRPPYIRFEDLTEYSRLLEGKGFPRILAFENGEIVAEWTIDTYTKEKVMSFYGIKEKKKSLELEILPSNSTWDQNKKNPWE